MDRTLKSVAVRGGELQHAHEHAKDVYVIWKPKKEPSPFITQTANKVFRSVDEVFAYFDQKGYFQPPQPVRQLTESHDVARPITSAVETA